MDPRKEISVDSSSITRSWPSSATPCNMPPSRDSPVFGFLVPREANDRVAVFVRPIGSSASRAFAVSIQGPLTKESEQARVESHWRDNQYSSAVPRTPIIAAGTTPRFETTTVSQSWARDRTTSRLLKCSFYHIWELLSRKKLYCGEP